MWSHPCEEIKLYVLSPCAPSVCYIPDAIGPSFTLEQSISLNCSTRDSPLITWRLRFEIVLGTIGNPSENNLGRATIDVLGLLLPKLVKPTEQAYIEVNAWSPAVTGLPDMSKWRPVLTGCPLPLSDKHSVGHLTLRISMLFRFWCSWGHLWSLSIR